MKALVPATLFFLAACNSSSTSSPVQTIPSAPPSVAAVPSTEAAPSATIAAPTTEAIASAKPTATSINAFNSDLYAHLKIQKGNLIYSPASIEAALAMTEAGARGTTATEMAKVLHLPADSNLAASQFSALLASWAQTDASGPILTVSNRLWVQKDYALLPDYSTLTRDKYFAPIDQLDFKQAATSSQTINAWVSQSTHGKINDLISPGNITDATRLILTNAVYFKGKWSEPFEKSATQNGTFTTDDSSRLTVPLMNHMYAARNYADVGNAQIIDLPYQGTAAREMVMTLVLPKTGTPLSAIENALTQKQLDSWIAKESGQRVRVTLPKFKAEQTMTLSSILTAMGMPTAFTPKADFSGISAAHEGLLISEVVHKAYVDVDETGTEAAAATAVMAVTGAAPPEVSPIAFRADHPFLFFLRDKTSGAILFAGRVSDPSKS
ncbi:MAG: serpin family protein [Polyangiaceae bacterium]